MKSHDLEQQPLNRWQASAPSNIALIKYMGKVDPNTNGPINSSLSYTLAHLRSTVSLEYVSGADSDVWGSSKSEHPTSLSAEGREKFLRHLLYLKNLFSFNGNFILRSKNNFPLGCGIASSASSFAALTQCAIEAMGALSHKTKDLSHEEVSRLSQRGSGSSCRSFFSPWALWSVGGTIQSCDFYHRNFTHHVVMVSEVEKKVSSTQAHSRVLSSLNFEGRPQRAERRLKALVLVLKDGSASAWRQAFEICWAEFWDMHSLFHTSHPAFSYMTERSYAGLELLQNLWLQEKDGPLVTMDAGPNIHLLFRSDQELLKERFLVQLRENNFNILRLTKFVE